MRSGRPDRQVGLPPPIPAFTPAERRIVGRLRTPEAVQAFLNRLPYNTERPPGSATLRSFRGVVRERTAHCLEAALAAAVILEQHGYPPLVVSFESIDELDHVIFVYRHRGRWGSVARSRDPGLHGRKPVFATPRALALSYVDTYVDFTGRVTGYTLLDLRDLLGDYDWRLSEKNVGRRSACCSTRRTGPSDRQTRGSTRCGRSMSNTADARRQEAALREPPHVSASATGNAANGRW